MHIKSERVIELNDDYSVREAVEDNWRISLVACVSCKIKMILENYLVEMTDEYQIFHESPYEIAPDCYTISARNRLHILMPKSDLVSMSPMMSAITHLIDKCVLNSSEMIIEEQLLARLRRDFEEIVRDIKDNKTTKAFQSLCEITEALLQYFNKEILKNSETKKKTFGNLIHSIFPEEISESPKHKRNRHKLFYSFYDINEKFCSVKHEQLHSEEIQISYEYLNYVLLEINELIDFLKLNIPTSSDPSID